VAVARTQCHTPDVLRFALPRPQGRDDELARHAVGAFAGWSCVFLLPAQAGALAGTNPPNRALLRDGLAPVLGATTLMTSMNAQHRAQHPVMAVGEKLNRRAEEMG
jgi:hypothetical protein